MAEMAIRELSAYVQYEAAHAQKTFWEVAEGRARASNFDILAWMKARLLLHTMTKLVGLEHRLIDRLKTVDFSQYNADMFDRIAGDLERIVSLTDSFVDDAYSMPEPCVRAWGSRLVEVSDLARHIDNFAESFRIASDEACTALLADIADNITKDVAIAAD